MATTHQLKPFRELLDASIETYKQHFKTIALLSAIMGVAVVVLGLVVGTPDPNNFSLTASEALRWFVAGTAYSFLAIWVTIAILLLAHDPGKHKTVPDLLSASADKLLPVALVTLASGFLTTLGLIALIIPGIVVAVWFIFTTQIVLFEHKRGVMETLQQSRKYVEGRWWAILGRCLLLALVMLVACVAFSIVSAIIAAILGSGLPGGAKTLNDLFSVFVVAPIAVIFSLYLYQSAAGHHQKHEA